MATMSLPEITPAPVKRKIVLAEVAGFCFGVRRAVDMTEKARRERLGRLTTLGPIIHNEQVISRMQGMGIETAPTLDTISEGTVVLSAHGVAPAVLEQAKAQGLEVLDVTCPFVTKVHRSAKQLYDQGYQILLVGDQGHTEVRGVVGAVEALGGSVSVVSKPEDVQALTLNKKVGVVCQTTQYADTFAAVVAEVCRHATDVRAINTVCGATDELQAAAVRLARQVDVAIVVGGRKSANTRRLRQLCEDEGIPAYHIETAAEIEPRWLEGSEAIGITAGASTPDWIIEDVARALNGGVLPDDWSLHHPDE
ncbi:MAG TPA: 4-hydroxy-3-methylbut-2-enyl diphosphate reductase [Chthonomonadaceae bacterium]|nr:4-hydroxy-3-methylbut-2-enyl diphosphate reductase [Chthonomonadaceae bacterium]